MPARPRTSPPPARSTPPPKPRVSTTARRAPRSLQGAGDAAARGSRVPAAQAGSPSSRSQGDHLARTAVVAPGNSRALASLTVPPAARAALLRSARSTSTMSRRRSKPRSVMSDDSVARTGATVRPIDIAVSTTSFMLVSGWRAACSAEWAIMPAPWPKAPANRSQSRIRLWRTSSPVPTCSPSDRAASTSGAAAIGSTSNSKSASCIPPKPSVSEWCTFITRAARPPSKFSTGTWRSWCSPRSFSTTSTTWRGPSLHCCCPTTTCRSCTSSTYSSFPTPSARSAPSSAGCRTRSAVPT
jgi:hypothetical protein